MGYVSKKAQHPKKWLLDQSLAPVFNIKADFYLIRGEHSETLYLLIGSKVALLVAAEVAPGLEAIIRPLTMEKRLEVALTSDAHDSVGGLSELSSARVYTASDNISKTITGGKRRLKEGDMIDLGYDRGGRPLRLEAHLFTFNGRSKLTLVDLSDRILFSGDALGMQGADGGVTLSPYDPDMRPALAARRNKTDGKYDVVYTASNYQWYTSATYVDEFSKAITRAALHDAQHVTNSKQYPGSRVYTSDGPQDVVASVIVSP